MGIIIELGKRTYSWGNRHNVKPNHNGLKLTKTGWKNFDITKHRPGGWRENKCSVCGNICCQSLGNLYQQICLNCADDFIDNSIDELEAIKDRLLEQKEYINSNSKEITKFERNKVEAWERLAILKELEKE